MLFNFDEREDQAVDLEEEVEERQLLHTLDAMVAASATGGSEPAADDFDALAVRAQTSERQRSLRRAEGEELLVPVYTEDTPPTDLSLVPPAERRRQIEAGRVLLYGVVLVGNRVVGETTVTQLNTFDFCARFSYSLQLQLLQAPSAIALQLWQRRLAGLADFMIAEIHLSTPEVASPAATRWQHCAPARSSNAEHPLLQLRSIC